MADLRNNYINYTFFYSRIELIPSFLDSFELSIFFFRLETDVQRGIEGFRHKAMRITATRLSGCVMSDRHGMALTLLCASRAWEVFRRYNN